MPSSKALSIRAHFDAAAAANPHFDIADWQQTFRDWWFTQADPRLLIDTPAERKAIDDEAVAAFDRLVRPAAIKNLGEVLAAAVLGYFEARLGKLLDSILVALAATLPPSPAPPVTPPAVGSSTQGSAP